jgi:hypothetical protein
MDTATQTRWRLVGEEVASCNCAWGCPCQFNALPTHGRCEALIAVQVSEGHFGDTRLDGVRFARIFWFPGAVHEGHGIRQLIIDAQATAEQQEALLAVDSGAHGGLIWGWTASAGARECAFRRWGTSRPSPSRTR